VNIELLSRHAKLVVELGSRCWIQAGAQIDSAEHRPRGNASIVVHRYERAKLANRWQNIFGGRGCLGHSTEP
jgi:hypothetical protein